MLSIKSELLRSGGGIELGAVRILDGEANPLSLLPRYLRKIDEVRSDD